MTPPPAYSQTTLVLGGARSGKSAYAESLVEGQSGACIYLATATAGDSEMAARIARHRARRGDRWRTVEEPLELPAALRDAAGPDRAVLVDCLTLWLANLTAAGRDPETEADDLVTALAGLAGPAVLVSNEVGLGIVPESTLGRAFRDHAGRLNQRLAGAADTVVFMVAGLPMTLRQNAGSA